MANLVVTNACNRSCSYCFAAPFVSTDPDCADSMTLEEYARLLDLLGDDDVRFCGGEPTLHPQFIDMLHLALQTTDKNVLLMTNGLWPETVQHDIARLKPWHRKRVHFLLNAIDADDDHCSFQQHFEATLAVLEASRMTLGLTLHDGRQNLEAFFELAQRYKVQDLRLSIAAPVLSNPRRAYTDLERSMRAMAERVVEFVQMAQTRQLRWFNDCCYVPPCMFTAQQLQTLMDCAGDDEALRFFCHGPNDVGPGGRVWRCFGLHETLSANLTEFGHIQALDEHFANSVQAYANAPLFAHCEDCALQQRFACGGGCHALKILQQTRARLRQVNVDFDDDSDILRHRPMVDSQRLRSANVRDRSIWMCRQYDTWEPIDVSPLEQHVLDLCTNELSTRQILEQLSVAFPGQYSSASMCCIVRRFVVLNAVGLRSVEKAIDLG